MSRYPRGEVGSVTTKIFITREGVEFEVRVTFGARSDVEGVEIHDEPACCEDEDGKEIELTPDELGRAYAEAHHAQFEVDRGD